MGQCTSTQMYIKFHEKFAGNHHKRGLIKRDVRLGKWLCVASIALERG